MQEHSAGLGLDEEAPKEQDAQYQQNSDYDDLNQGHGRFLDSQRLVDKNRRQNHHYSKSALLEVSTKHELMSEKLYGFRRSWVQCIL